MNENLITLTRAKIEWYNSTCVDFIERGILIKKKFEEMSASGIKEDDKELLISRLNQQFCNDISELLRYRASDAKCLIKSMERPNDIYLRAHANIITSEHQVKKILEVWDIFKNAANENYPWVIGVINKLEIELQEVVNNDYYKLDFIW